MLRTSRFVYATDDLVLRWPVGLWRHEQVGIGGEIESDARVPASYTVRRNYFLMLPLQFVEAEWSRIRNLITYGQLGGLLTWYPDADVDESWSVYLGVPVAGEDVAPARSAEYPRLLTIGIGLRRADDQPWDGFYFFSDLAGSQS